MRTYSNGTATPKQPQKKSSCSIDVKFWIVLAVAFVAIGVCVFTFLNKNKSADNVTVASGSNLVLDTSAQADVDVNVENDNNMENYLSFQGYDDMTLTQGQAVRLMNVASNKGVYMKYSIVDESGKVVYETDLIPPGEYVRAVLSDYLNPGDYELSFVQEGYSANGEAFDFMTNATNVVKVTIVG